VREDDKIIYLICLSTERQIKGAGVVFQNPTKGLVVFWVDPFNVSIIDGFSKELSVQTSSEVRVQQPPIEYSLPDDPPDELEERKVLGVDSGGSVWLIC
jgi:hypothetical protein